MEIETYLKTSSFNKQINEILEQTVGKEQCTVCGKKTLKRNMSAHMKRCNIKGRKNYLCMIGSCQSAFTVKQDLFSHINKIHVSRMKCPRDNCNVYIKPTGLTQHIKTVHEMAKKTCPNCGKQIPYVHLTRHIECCTSDGKKKFPCTFRNCDSSFATKSNRSLHISRVHKSPTKCPYDDCDATLRPANLPRHVKEVHDKFRRKCEFCEQEFTRNQNLKKHMEYCSRQARLRSSDS